MSEPEQMVSGTDFINRPRVVPDEAPEPPPPPAEADADQSSANTAPPPPTPPSPEQPGGPMSAAEFLGARHRQARSRVAGWGWRRNLRLATLGLIKPAMGPAEKAHHDNLEAVQATFRGAKTVMVANHKGAATKTPTSILLAATLGVARGGGVLAWDNNELEGTLGLRSEPAHHSNTIVELLEDVERLLATPDTRLGDMYAYVRGQGASKFDVLASAEFGLAEAMISRENFEAAHQLMSRFYPMMIVDTGNNRRSANWMAALDTADLLVVPTTVKADAGAVGLSMLDKLTADGYEHLVKSAVVVVSHHGPRVDESIRSWLDESFAHRVGSVVHVPYDPAVADGDRVNYQNLSHASREAWLAAAARVAQSL